MNQTIDFHEFPGRSHLLVAGEGWQEVADYILNWLQDQKLSEGAGAAAAA